MKCPKCESEMVDGTADIHGTVLRWLFVGLSWESLWFRPQSSSKRSDRELVLDSGNTAGGIAMPAVLHCCDCAQFSGRGMDSAGVAHLTSSVNRSISLVPGGPLRPSRSESVVHLLRSCRGRLRPCDACWRPCQGTKDDGAG